MPGTFSIQTAFSRQDPTKKVYVQHLIVEHAEEIRELIMLRDAHVYICGDAHRMAKDVFTQMTSVISEHQCFGGDAAEAEDFLRLLKAHGRWAEDVW
jgi:NADPH-ferrihemoprotein reductase